MIVVEKVTPRSAVLYLVKATMELRADRSVIHILIMCSVNAEFLSRMDLTIPQDKKATNHEYVSYHQLSTRKPVRYSYHPMSLIEKPL